MDGHGDLHGFRDGGVVVVDRLVVLNRGRCNERSCRPQLLRFPRLLDRSGSTEGQHADPDRECARCLIDGVGNDLPALESGQPMGFTHEAEYAHAVGPDLELEVDEPPHACLVHSAVGGKRCGKDREYAVKRHRDTWVQVGVGRTKLPSPGAPITDPSRKTQRPPSQVDTTLPRTSRPWYGLHPTA